MHMNLYPLKFDPLLKTIIWGGEKISKYKKLNTSLEKIGESWEISDVPGNISIVSNGELKGKNLDEVISLYGERLVGKSIIERFGNTFPLLIKFIDAQQNLSIQVHPDDKLAQKRHHTPGKTEMWYVVEATDQAFLYSGFEKELPKEKYQSYVNDSKLLDYLKKHSVKAGDVFYLPAGRIHAIGAGCFIVEIQQTSDITYRLYDYDRKDKNGNPRELHTEMAMDAIDFNVYPEYKVDYKLGKKQQQLVNSPYFITNLIEGEKGEIIHSTHNDTFVVYICIEGKAQLTDNKGNSIDIEQGETVLIPAENAHLITILITEKSKMLETFL